MYEVMFIVSEGERKIQFHRVLLSKDKGVSPIEYGKFIMRTNDCQETHDGEGFCRRNIFVSTIKKNYSETGAVLRHVGSKLMKKIQRVILTVGVFELSGASLVSVRHNNNLIGAVFNEVLGTFLRKLRNLEVEVRFAGKFEVGFLIFEAMFLVSEGEKMIRFYGILFSEDEGVSFVEQGKFIMKTNNCLETHDEGRFCRRIVFVSSIKEENLESGVIVHLSENELMDDVWRKTIVPQIGEEGLESSRSNNALIEMDKFKIF
jgi:hypothetical protein